jgi:hypothetical protein
MTGPNGGQVFVTVRERSVPDADPERRVNIAQYDEEQPGKSRAQADANKTRWELRKELRNKLRSLRTLQRETAKISRQYSEIMGSDYELSDWAAYFERAEGVARRKRAETRSQNAEKTKAKVTSTKAKNASQTAAASETTTASVQKTSTTTSETVIPKELELRTQAAVKLNAYLLTAKKKRAEARATAAAAEATAAASECEDDLAMDTTGVHEGDDDLETGDQETDAGQDSDLITRMQKTNLEQFRHSSVGSVTSPTQSTAPAQPDDDQKSTTSQDFY